jgi:hypothetical protein
MNESESQNHLKDLQPHPAFRIKDLILIPYDDNVDATLDDEAKTVVVKQLEECLPLNETTGRVAIIWPYADGTMGFFPGDIPELQKLAKENLFKAIRKRCDAKFFCTF